MGKKEHPPQQTSTTLDIHHTMCRSGVVDVLFYPWCGGCLVWWISGLVDVHCPVWWMSGVVVVLFYPWCGGCLVWWMSVWWMSYNQFLGDNFMWPVFAKKNWGDNRMCPDFLLKMRRQSHLASFCYDFWGANCMWQVFAKKNWGNSRMSPIFLKRLRTQLYVASFCYDIFRVRVA